MKKQQIQWTPRTRTTSHITHMAQIVHQRSGFPCSLGLAGFSFPKLRRLTTDLQ
jgi:hypothetical protein